MDERRLTAMRKAVKHHVYDLSTIHYENKITSVHIPGFMYDDFNRAGNVSIAELCGLLEICREDNFFKKLQEEGTFFFALIACHFTVSRQLYDRAAIEFPMKYSYQLSSVGRSSIDSKVTVTEQLTGEPLLTCQLRSVAVSTKSQTSMAFADSVRQVLLEKVVPGGDAFPVFHPPSSIPEHTFSCRITVRYSDMDRLFHTSTKGYFAIIEECAAQATAAGFYSTVDGDIAFYQTESVSAVFFGESFAGDELELTTWEDLANGVWLYFVVRKNEQSICYAKMKFVEKCAKE
jgi:acyl-CoA thioesterase FadM